MEEADLDIVDEYQIPNKNTPLHLLDTEFVFDDALELVQNLDLIQQNLWPENHYRELNIIYKGEKNADKMKKSLEKHRRKLTEIAQTYIEDDADNYIAQKSREAFQAIMDYFDGILEADRIHILIEPAIMIQRMISKAKEIFDKDVYKRQLLNNIKNQLDDQGKATLSAYLALVENFAPFMQSGVIDSLQKGKADTEPDKTSLEYKMQIKELTDMITLFLSQGFTKEETQSTLLDMANYRHLREDIIRLVGDCLLYTSRCV